MDDSTVHVLFYELVTPKWLEETPNIEVNKETPDDEDMDTSTYEGDNNHTSTFNIYWQN